MLTEHEGLQDLAIKAKDDLSNHEKLELMLQLKTLAQGEEPIIYLLRHLEKKNVFIDEAMKQLSKWQCVVDFFATPGARQMVNASIGDSISLSVLRFLKKQLHERRITEY